LLNKPVLLVNLHGLYSDCHTDVEVSSGDDDASKIDALAVESRAPADDEADVEGISSVEPIVPGLISSYTPVHADPSVVDRVISSAPSTGRQKRKHPPPIPKCKTTKSSVDHVMIQIEHSPYREPWHPLDLVAIEIVFWHLFEVFWHTSQAASTET
jgi:hypothetical protein